MAVALPVGLFNLGNAQFGLGPNDVASYKFKAAGYLPSQGGIVADIAKADTNSIYLFTALAGNGVSFTDAQPDGTRIYNQAKYELNIRKWTTAGGATAAVADAVSDALDRRRMIVYLCDEPFHPKYNGTITKDAQNAMGLLAKSIWPGCITCIRSDFDHMTPAPTGGYTGIDYGWSQFESNHAPSAGQTPGAFYTYEKSGFAGMDMGMIPGLNLWDGGIYTNLDGVTACWDYSANGISSGFVKGTFSGTAAPGTTWTCSTKPANETRVVANPALIRRMADVVATDTDAPAFMIWTYPYSSWGDVGTFRPYYLRNDFVSALTYMVSTLSARASWTGWRAAKGGSSSTTGGGGAVGSSSTTGGVVHTGSVATSGISVTLPTHKTGDLVVALAYNSGGSTVPSNVAGWTTLNSGGVYGMRSSWRTASSGAMISGSWTNATDLIMSVYSSQHTTTPINYQTGNFGVNATMIYPTSTDYLDTTGWSYVAAHGVHHGATNVGDPPTGMVNRATTASGHVAAFDTNSGVTTFPNTNVSMNVSDAWRNHMIEIISDLSSVVTSSSTPVSSTTYFGVTPASRSTTTNTVYQNPSTASIAASRFTAGNTYFLLASAMLSGSSVTAQSYCQLQHGTTTWPDAELSMQPNTTAARFPYSWFGVHQMVSAETMQLQYKSEDTQTETGIDQIALSMLDLSQVAEGVDYFLSETSTAVALTSSNVTGASVTFKPDVSGDKWLLCSLDYFTQPGAAQSVVHQQNLVGTLTRSGPVASIGGEDAGALDTYPIVLYSACTLSNSTHTFAALAKNDGSTGTRAASKVLALNLSRWSYSDFTYSDTLVAYASGDYSTNMAKLTITPGSTASFLLLGQQVATITAANVNFKQRLQSDATDWVTLQTPNAYAVMTSWNTTDLLPMSQSAFTTWSASTHTLTLDSSATASAGRGGKGRLLVAIGTDLAPPGIPSGGEAGLPPSLDTLSTMTVYAQEKVSFIVSGSDPEGEQVSFGLTLTGTLVPYGATMDATTGQFLWTPLGEQGPGTYPVEVFVTDGSNEVRSIVTLVVLDVPWTRRTSRDSNPAGSAFSRVV